MKPKHQHGYSALHTTLCERTLVTLLRGIGPWKAGVYVIGGLAPRYLIPASEQEEGTPAHIGTTDVDLLLNLTLLTEIEAYSKLEQNLKALHFERGKNIEGDPQHFSWRKEVGGGATVVVDLLCDKPVEQGGKATPITGEKRLSALGIPGAYLAMEDFIEVSLTEEMLDGRGVATEIVRVANIVPLVVLKCLAYDDRVEEKDAYDIIYCLTHYKNGPESVAKAYAASLLRLPDDPLLRKAIDILKSRFTSDATPGYRKDGPVSYARFHADPSRTDLNAVRQRDAAAVVEAFLSHLALRQEETP